jgi:hypothetical protein
VKKRNWYKYVPRVSPGQRLQHALAKANRLATCISSVQEKATAENWTAERDNALKEAYQKKRAELWKVLANEMDSQTSWKVIEQRIFKIRRKGLNGA